jgi:hypothetical protein
MSYDRNSPFWLQLRRDINQRIEARRLDLEQPGMEPDYLRGQIAALREIIKVVEPDPPITEPTSTDYSKPPM